MISNRMTGLLQSLSVMISFHMESNRNLLSKESILQDYACRCGAAKHTAQLWGCSSNSNAKSLLTTPMRSCVSFKNSAFESTVAESACCVFQNPIISHIITSHIEPMSQWQGMTKVKELKTRMTSIGFGSGILGERQDQLLPASTPDPSRFPDITVSVGSIGHPENCHWPCRFMRLGDQQIQVLFKREVREKLA